MVVEFFNEIDSTNTYLKDKKDKNQWDIAAAFTQTAGRGRREKKWHSGFGGAWFSTVIKEDKNLPFEEYLKLPIVVCYAVLKYLENKTGLELRYKWINDIYCNDKKLCGILVEKSGEFFIVGIGINSNNTEFGENHMTATSLKLETGKEYNVAEIVEEVVDEIKSAYMMFLRGEWKSIIGWLSTRDFLIGREVTVRTDNCEQKGLVIGIDENGRLEIKNGETLLKIDSGEIIWK